MPKSSILISAFFMLCLSLGTWAEDNCNEKACSYTVSLEKAGFYIAAVKLPPGQPEGLWSLIINPPSVHRGSFHGGGLLEKTGTIPSWLGFSLAQSGMVSIEPFNYSDNSVPFYLKLMKTQMNNQHQLVWGPELVYQDQTYLTPSLQPGFYLAETRSIEQRQDFFGLSVSNPSLFGGVSGSWLDSQTGVGFAAFDITRPQEVIFNLWFGQSYGNLGAEKPYLKLYYQEQDGTRILYWPSSESAEDADLTKDIKDLEYLPGSEKLYILQDGLQVNVLVNDELVRHISLRGMSNPQGMALDNQENLYVADTDNHRIVKLAAEGDYQPDPLIFPDGSFGIQGAENGQFQAPEDVVIGRVKGELVIYVADTGNNRIQRFNRAGVFQMAFDGSDSPEGALKAPSSLLIMDGGGIAVVDSGNGRIRVFNSEGQSLRSFGSLGNAAGQLTEPLKISQSFIGSKLIVADTGNNRVQLFRSSGEFEREITGLKQAPAVAIFRNTLLGEQLEIAPIKGGVSEIENIALSEDPPGNTPVDVVRNFLAALAGQDVQTAKTLLAETRSDALATYEQEPTQLAQLGQEAQKVGELVLMQKQQNLAFVIGIRNDGEIVEIGLMRDAESNTWKISVF